MFRPRNFNLKKRTYRFTTKWWVVGAVVFRTVLLKNYLRGESFSFLLFFWCICNLLQFWYFCILNLFSGTSRWWFCLLDILLNLDGNKEIWLLFAKSHTCLEVDLGRVNCFCKSCLLNSKLLHLLPIITLYQISINNIVNYTFLFPKFHLQFIKPKFPI